MTRDCVLAWTAALLVGLSQAPAPARATEASAPDWLSAVADLPQDGFAPLSGAWVLDLPRDHGAHPDARTEVWQLAAHLQDEDGRPVGVQWLVFRLALLPPDAETRGPWAPREVLRGHTIVMSGAEAVAHGSERLGRGLPGLAGHDPETHELRLDDWSLTFAPDAGDWRLRAAAGPVRVALDLTPTRAPVTLDADEAPFRGYAIPRLEASGMVETRGGTTAVSGHVWFDHAWGELPVPGTAAVVSDRLQVQLDDGTDLLVVRSRRTDGRGTADVDAILIDAEGRAEPQGDSREVTIVGRWQGALANWPVAWDLRLGDLELAIRPVTEDQEQPFAPPLWSGLVRAEGQRGGRPLTGLGTLQLSAEGLQ